ncbi:retention module-containing protein, partial [Pseudomonas sp. NPDC088368]|uniref:retention module-containing protein n=1 Tax=Pseudomonas sp. NPDC088368 TaxID=3364453 RepID=UPI0038263D2F
MSSVVAIVKSIVGQVVAVSAEGIRRVLIEGDRLLAGEQVLTGPGGAVTLELADGRHLDLGRDTQWSADTPASSSTTDLAEATAQAAPSVAELQQAIAAGADPTQDLEATAAGQTTGSTDGGNAGGGHSVVMLTETAGVVDPTIGYPTGPIGSGAATDTQRTALDDPSNTRTPSTLSLTGTPTITEAGGVLVYTATLTVAAQSAITVTLSNGAIINIDAGQLSGSVNVPMNSINDVYLNPSQISTTVTGTTGGDGIAITIDPQPANTQVTDTIDTTTVSLSADAAATEGGQITYTATLTNAAQTAVTVTLSNGAIINIAAGQSVGTIKVDAPANDVYKTSATVNATITGASGGNFEQLAIDGKAASTTIADSIDTTRVTLTASSTVAENGTITYTASVSNPVTGSPVSVTLDNGKTITIGVGQSSGSTTAVATNDVYVGHPAVTAAITGVSGGNYENLAFSNTPVSTAVTDVRDTTSISISGPSAVTEGGTAVYTLSLDNPAHATVNVTLSYTGTAKDGTDFTAVKTVTIPANASSANFALTTLENGIEDGARDVIVKIVSATGGNFENLAVSGSAGSVTTSILDNDAPVIIPPDPVAPHVDLDGTSAGDNYSFSYTGSDPAVAIAKGATIVDSDSDNLSRVEITISKGSQAGDLLSHGALPSGITLDPASTDTHIILVGPATKAAFQDAVNSITFSSSDTTGSTRTISVVATDEDKHSSNTAQTEVTLNGGPTSPVDTNAAPTIEFTPGAFVEGGAAVSLIKTISIADSDAPGGATPQIGKVVITVSNV